jgi:mRNA interferase MazF
MAWDRGDVVLIPFPYSDLNTVKTRPAVIVGNPDYQVVRHELLLTYLTAQISQSHPYLDHLLVDWHTAGLLKPTLMKPRLATIHETLVRHHVGKLSAGDMIEVDQRLRRAIVPHRTALDDLLAQTNLLGHRAASVQRLAEAALSAAVDFASRGDSAIDLVRLRALFPPGANS